MTINKEHRAMEPKPLITQFREGHRLMRATALLVLCCFGVVFYSPAVQASIKAIDDYFKYQPDYPLFAELNEALNDTQQLLTRYKTLATTQPVAPGKKQQSEFSEQLDSLIDRFADLDDDALDYFDDQQGFYQQQQLPAAALNALQQRQQQYSQTMATLQQQLQRLAKAKDPQKQQRALTHSAKLLKRIYRKPTHHPYDQSMPFGTLSSTVRAAYTNPLDLQALLGTAAPAQPTAEDQQATIDTPLTTAIQQQAATLGNDPVAIYNWVYNNITFIPSYGSIQGAAYTMETGQGNAIDIASLLIALLRSAGIAARYHYGTVNIPLDEAMNWVGGVKETQAAGNLLAQGGIPSTLHRIDGVDSHFAIEHVWVDIWDGSQWQQVDPSYKQYTYSDGIDLQTQVPFDAQAFATTLESTATVNETEGWVQNVNQAFIQTELDDYRTALETYLTNQQSDATVGDVIGSKTIITTSAATLPSTLPYNDIVVEQSISALPATLRHQFIFELQDEYNNTLFSHTLSTPELAGKKLAMSFAPATAADEQALIDYLPVDPQTPEELPNIIPANLFNVVGEFSVDGVVVASSPAINFGRELNTTKGLWSPKGGWETTSNPIITGEYQAVGVDLHGLSPQQLTDLQTSLESTQALLTAEDYTNLTKHDVVGDLLQSGVMSFMAMTHIQNQLSAQSSDIVYYREPSYGTFATNAKINYLFTQPQNVEMTGLLMDMDRMKSSAECKINCWEDWRDFNQQSGAAMSAYEHLIPEQLFSTDTDPVEGVSAVKALAIASSQGQRIYTFDQSNLLYLNDLTIEQAIKDEITVQVNVGFVATVHQHPITYAGWTGVGYTVVDPETGAGAYKISGGSDGSSSLLDNYPAGFVTTSLMGIGGLAVLAGAGGILPVLSLAIVIISIFHVLMTYMIADLQLAENGCSEVMRDLLAMVTILLAILPKVLSSGVTSIALGMSSMIVRGATVSASPACRSLP